MNASDPTVKKNTRRRRRQLHVVSAFKDGLLIPACLYSDRRSLYLLYVSHKTSPYLLGYTLKKD